MATNMFRCCHTHLYLRGCLRKCSSIKRCERLQELLWQWTTLWAINLSSTSVTSCQKVFLPGWGSGTWQSKRKLRWPFCINWVDMIGKTILGQECVFGVWQGWAKLLLPFVFPPDWCHYLRLSPTNATVSWQPLSSALLIMSFPLYICISLHH